MEPTRKRSSVADHGDPHLILHVLPPHLRLVPVHRPAGKTQRLPSARATGNWDDDVRCRQPPAVRTARKCD